jgi:hypothetical protein
MSLWIGGANAIDQIGQQNWAQFAIECGFTAAFVRRRVGELAETLRDALPHIFEAVVTQHPVAIPAATAVREGVTQQVNMILRQS